MLLSLVFISAQWPCRVFSYFVAFISLPLTCPLHHASIPPQSSIAPHHPFHLYIFSIFLLATSARLLLSKVWYLQINHVVSFTSTRRQDSLCPTAHLGLDLVPPYCNPWARRYLLIESIDTLKHFVEETTLALNNGRRQPRTQARVHGLHSGLQQQALQRWRTTGTAATTTAPSPKRLQAHGMSHI